MSRKPKEPDLLKKDHPKRLIRIGDVVNLTNLSQSYIYQLSDDGLFPKSIKLVPGGTSVAWVESEVLSWIDSRIEARNRESNSSATIDYVEEDSAINSPSADLEVA